MKMSAPTSGEPTREIELLIAEASPEYRPDTEPISVVVSGATTNDMPEAEQQHGRQDVRDRAQRRDER